MIENVKLGTQIGKSKSLKFIFVFMLLFSVLTFICSTFSYAAENENSQSLKADLLNNKTASISNSTELQANANEKEFAPFGSAWFLQSIRDSFNNISAGGSDAKINEGILSTSKDLMKTVFLPVAYVLFCLFALLEFVKWQSAKSAVGDELGVESVGQLLLKLGVGKLMLDFSYLLMDALRGVSDYLMERVGDASATTMMDLTDEQIDQIGDVILDGSIGETIGSWGLLALTAGLAKIAGLAVTVLFIFRAVQICLLLAFSPIPASTIVNEEFRNMGTGFYKSFFAVCLQGVVLILVCKLIPSVIKITEIPTSDTVFSWCGDVIVYSAVLLLAIFTSQRLAKTVIQAT